MKDINDVLFIVEARLHSSRMHQKMIKPFADTTLLDLLLDIFPCGILPFIFPKKLLPNIIYNII